MKRFLCSLTLMMSLLGSGLALPATAQTPLLEIDYNGATVFHVLSDGRLLLPTGAADGYVLTTDVNGFATWQAATGTGGGLSTVTSDATLTGDGTAGNPLGVAVPLALTGGTGSNGTVSGTHSQGPLGLLGSDLFGALGLHSGGNIGTLGSSDYGAYGFSNGFNNTAAGVYGGHSSGTVGTLGSRSYGAYGESDDGPYGYLGGASFGAYGAYGNGNYGRLGSIHHGVYGVSNTGAGVSGQHANGNHGSLGHEDYGVYGEYNNDTYGSLGNFGAGVYGENVNGNLGWIGGQEDGVLGQHNNGNRGLLGGEDVGVLGLGSPWAGFFYGNVHVTGGLSKAGGSSKIDHPLDPAGRYLAHSFVESPDMKNVYDGTVTLDDQGEAVVELPEYFEALNRDFRYQLTCIGGFAPVYIAEKINGNRFKIAGGAPGLEVSWQVTGIRHDPWADENRIVVEADKPADERGRYLHPTLYGRPEAQRIGPVSEDEAAGVQEALRERIDEPRPSLPRPDNQP